MQQIQKDLKVTTSTTFKFKSKNSGSGLTPVDKAYMVNWLGGECVGVIKNPDYSGKWTPIHTATNLHIKSELVFNTKSEAYEWCKKILPYVDLSLSDIHQMLPYFCKSLKLHHNTEIDEEDVNELASFFVDPDKYISKVIAAHKEKNPMAYRVKNQRNT